MKAVELETNASDRWAAGEILPEHPVEHLVQWVLSEEIFVCAVIVQNGGWFGRLAGCRRLAVITERTAFPTASSSFIDAAYKGFSAVLGVQCEAEFLIQRLETLSYRISGRGSVGTGDRHDPVAATPDVASLVEMIELASAKGAGTLCLFGHDADPVYVLYM